jgi:hypothetical protein
MRLLARQDLASFSASRDGPRAKNAALGASRRGSSECSRDPCRRGCERANVATRVTTCRMAMDRKG